MYSEAYLDINKEEGWLDLTQEGWESISEEGRRSIDAWED